MSDTPAVGVLMGSASDFPVMQPAVEMLKQFGVAHEVEVVSAHRSPEEARQYALEAEERGLKVLIVGAGGAAHLAGVVAAHSLLPVIAVPVNATPLNGMDALLASVQMPTGIPVACVAIDGSANAALLAVTVLARLDTSIREQLKVYRGQLRDKTRQRAADLKRKLQET